MTKERIPFRDQRILNHVHPAVHATAMFGLISLLLTGCAAPKRSVRELPERHPQLPIIKTEPSVVTQVVHQTTGRTNHKVASPERLPQQITYPQESLSDLTFAAETSNPTLRRLSQEYQAARAGARYIDELPDPTLGTNVFGHPIETAAGSQRANLTLSQMLPWLPRLDAQAQQACLEAAALGQVFAAERLKVIANVRALWYRLYVIERHIEINTANQELLKSLIDVANARVATGNASQGDILIGTLAFSRLEESLVELRQQRSTTISEINRQVGRDAEISISPPAQLAVTLPDWNHRTLRDFAWTHQPDIESARIRAQASRWGIEVARLRRRPDISLSAAWFAIDDNRPPTTVVDVGRDAWSLGATMTVPLYHAKNDAMEQEARWQHAASHSSVEQVMQRYDSTLLDLWEQARAANETAELYRATIIPEAKRALSADQQSYGNGKVGFDRVMGDFRNLLTLELGYHRSMGQLATAIARIKQATGTELTTPGVPVQKEPIGRPGTEFLAEPILNPSRPPEPAEID